MAEPTVIDPKTAQPGTAVATPPPEKKDAPPPKAPTKEELTGIQKFAHSFLPEKFAAPKQETPEEKSAREKAEKEAADKKRLTTPAKKKIPARRAEPGPSLTPDQIAEAAARGVATALAPKKDEEVKKNEEPELSPADQRKVTVLEQMEKMEPEKYKGLAQRFKDSSAALKAYAEQWEKDHPGQEFNEEDAEHEEFFNKHDVDWSDEDYTEAVAEMRTQKALEEERKKTNERLSVFERNEKLREAAPEIAKAQTQPARLLWGQFGKDFADIVDANGVLNIEKALELKKSDPLTFGARVQAAKALDVEVGELYKVMNGLSDYDAKNPAHVAIGNFATHEELKMQKRPIEDRMDAEGRDFLPAADYYKLSKTKREEYWTFGVADLAALRAADLADLTTKLITAEEENHKKWAELRGFKKGEVAAAPAQEAKVEDETPSEPDDGKPKGPSSSSESRMTAARRATGTVAPDPHLTFLQRQLGKK